MANKPLKSFTAASEEINILVIVDTDSVGNIPNPSQNMDQPTGINHEWAWMIAQDPRGVISGQGTADLNFRANPGDDLRVRGTSIYQQSDSAIIVYDFRYWSGDHVFNDFHSDIVTRTGAVMPQPHGNGLPAVQQQINFISLDTIISGKGTENFYVFFALYKLDDSGENQNLYGYFFWDPTCTVK